MSFVRRCLFWHPFLTVALVALAGSSARSAETPEELMNRYVWRIQNTLQTVKTMQPECEECGHYNQTFMLPKSAACRKAYRDLYKIDDSRSTEPRAPREIDMRMFFGYMDYQNGTEDSYVSAAAIYMLTGRCKNGNYACEFVRDEDDQTIFRKAVKVLGPDGKVRQRIVKLTIMNSSETNDEKANRGAKAAEQQARSEEVSAAFVDGLKNADAVLYMGHARDGGGPDFSPPVVNSKKRQTDYEWYHKNRVGLDRMTSALQEGQAAGHSPKLLGIFACYAQDHFRKPLMKVAPDSGLVLSSRSEFESVLGQGIATLDSMLGMRCEQDFSEAVNSIKNANDLSIGTVSVDNFFKN